MTAFIYTPVHLAEAVREARRRHTADSPHRGRVGGQELEKLLAAIRRASAEECAVMFGRLRHGQLAALAAHLPDSVDEPPLFDKLEVGLLGRRCSVVAEGLCRLVAAHCQELQVMRVVSGILADEEWDPMLPGDLPSLPEGLDIGDADRLASLLASRYAQSRAPWRQFTGTLRAFGPRGDDVDWFALTLGRLIVTQLVTKQPRAVFRRELAETISGWIRALPSIEMVKAIARGYLKERSVASWDTLVLRELVDRLDDPRRRPENWQGISQELLQAVIRWINNTKLAEFFIRGAGDQDRYAFWEQFVDHMGMNSEGRIGAGQGLFEFPGFGVVEFMETGNAAYIYPLDVYHRFLNRRPIPPNGYLKDRDLVLYLGAQEGRIIHSGDWQWSWGSRIRALIRAGGSR